MVYIETNRPVRGLKIDKYPVGTRLRYVSCGCEVVREYPTYAFYETDCRLLKPGPDCAEEINGMDTIPDRDRDRLSEKQRDALAAKTYIGAHGRRIGYVGWTFELFEPCVGQWVPNGTEPLPVSDTSGDVSASIAE